MHTVTFSTVLPCSQDKAFAFHCDTQNLPLITPPWIDVTIKKLVLPLNEGSRIDLVISRWGLPQRWNMEIETLSAPYKVVDKAIDSPFAFFRHTHSFERIDGAHTYMVDTVEFKLPLWPLSWVALWFVKKDLEKMFDYRHARTSLLLEK